ncbi:hypothetical protein C4588_07235 [Candidatus Parcubacteria bacterium]|nr:MAG: hypothetical protein C4588_07235 [Candidatus Parcubacteria bacterium]
MALSIVASGGKSIDIKLESTRLRKALQKLTGEQVSDLFREIGIRWQNYVMTGMSPGPPPSSPGRPPAVRTGNLRSNLHWEMDNGLSSVADTKQVKRGATELRLGVSARARYGYFLETSKNHRMRRPFMVPALEKVLQELRLV